MQHKDAPKLLASEQTKRQILKSAVTTSFPSALKARKAWLREAWRSWHLATFSRICWDPVKMIQNLHRKIKLSLFYIYALRVYDLETITCMIQLPIISYNFLPWSTQDDPSTQKHPKILKITKSCLRKWSPWSTWRSTSSIFYNNSWVHGETTSTE